MIAGSGRRPTSAARSSANDCATLSAKSNCSFDHEVCLDSPQVGACQVKSEVYKCTTPATTQTTQAYSCSGDVYCIDGAAPSFRHRRRLIWPMRSWR
jgi:hypothetical protein